jgi:hypothetical protein
MSAIFMRALVAGAVGLACVALGACTNSSSGGKTSSGQGVDDGGDATSSSGSGSGGSSGGSSGSGSGGQNDDGGLSDAPYESGSTTGCTGTPTPCDLLSQSQCATTPGCSTTGGCSGLAESCTLFNGNSFLCIQQQGCFYDSTGMLCNGSPFQCSTLMNSGACIQQQGCNWANSSCSGVPIATCIGTTQASCTSVPGCIWQ